MWVTKLLISPVKIRIFCPKTTKFGPKLGFLFILGQALLAHLVPCWWVGWWLWCAGCISQDTYLLYHVYLQSYCRIYRSAWSHYCLLNCWRPDCRQRHFKPWLTFMICSIIPQLFTQTSLLERESFQTMQ